LITDGSLYERIADSRVVVGFRSTGVIEAVALDRVAVQLSPSEAPEDWTKRGLFGTSDDAAIAAEIERLVKDDDYYSRRQTEQQAVRDVLFGDLENASERIADHLYDMLSHPATTERN